MTQRGLFRVLIKAFGLYFVVDGGVTLLHQLSSIFYTLASGGRSYPNWFGDTLLLTAYGAGMLIAGCYLFFGGRFILDLAFPRGPNRCHECGYDLSGHASQICPECATRVTPTPDTPGDKR